MRFHAVSAAACVAVLSVWSGPEALSAPGDQLAKFGASDAAPADEFGTSVGISGLLAVVGAPLEDAGGISAGAAYLYTLTSGAELAKLVPSDLSANDRFGYAVAIDGNIVLVSSYFDDDAGTNAGAVYVFDVSNPTSPQELAKITAKDGVAGDRFGWSVSLRGSIAVIGSPLHDADGTNSGAAYVFDLSVPAEPVELTKIVRGEPGANDQFGWAVATDGQRIIVGAPFDDDQGTDSGSAYLYDAVSGSLISNLTDLVDLSPGDTFGTSVDLDGRRIVAGAPRDDDNGLDAGAAYLFDALVPSQPLFDLKLFPKTPTGNDQFGAAVAVDGFFVVVGAPQTDLAGTDSGAAYLFDARIGLQVSEMIPDDSMTGDRFGVGIDIQPTTAIFGAILDDDGGSGSGSAYVFSTSYCPEIDADDSGIVDLGDLNIMLANFGQIVEPGTLGDANANGVVNLTDLNIILVEFGNPCL